MDEILEILDGLGLDADFESCTTLVDDGILESLDIVTIIAELSDAFDITIPARDIVPENFNSAEAMLGMVNRLLDE
jgi:D-alanine--poly(phosphoribitol) ligase subunit 2